MIGGDLNFAENPKLDRHKCHEKQTDTSSHSFNDLKTNFGLVDVWRYMHPNKKQFTYRDISRIDMFIVSEELLGQIQKSNIIIGGVKSDHKVIEIKIQLNKNKRGPGTWKMNTTILEDKPFQKHITHVIKETRKNYDNVSNQILWEICKIKIKEESIAYCKQKQMIKKMSGRD